MVAVEEDSGQASSLSKRLTVLAPAVSLAEAVQS